jgi:hypothetical protein
VKTTSNNTRILYFSPYICPRCGYNIYINDDARPGTPICRFCGTALQFNNKSKGMVLLAYRDKVVEVKYLHPQSQEWKQRLNVFSAEYNDWGN